VLGRNAKVFRQCCYRSFTEFTNALEDALPLGTPGKLPVDIVHDVEMQATLIIDMLNRD